MTQSAEEAADDFEDPGWAPSATLRVAALTDHLSELSSPTGGNLEAPIPAPAAVPDRPEAPDVPWVQIRVRELREELSALAQQGVEVVVFDAHDDACIARATSWHGEIVDAVELTTIAQRIAAQRGIVRAAGNDNNAKKAARAEIERLEAKSASWAHACVRAGFARAHLGPDLTADFFERHVVGRERLDVTVDVNAIVYGIVHHIARLAPHVDFARSAVTDLEIQRLADHDRETWRKACRALESFPIEGPAWRALGPPDTTALLVARADQKGKAAGADALLAHNFEEALLRAHGIRCVLLTADNGLARTIAARMRDGAIWVGYVDPPRLEERFLSPILSWPNGALASSRYASLADLLDELLVCGVSNQLVMTDGTTTLEMRAYLEGEHQYVTDWNDPRLFVRRTELPPPERPAAPTPPWPLRELHAPPERRSSGARVTVDQAALSLEWVRSSGADQLRRDQVPLEGEARNEGWNFLRAIDVVDHEGSPVGRSLLSTAAAHRDLDMLRGLVLRFDPVARIVEALDSGERTVAAIKEASGLGERTFGGTLVLAVASGLAWRDGERVGPGTGFWPRDRFRGWLVAILREPMRVSALAQRSCLELRMSPVRFRDALAAVVNDPIFHGTRGGSSEPHGLDTKVIDFDARGRICVQELRADDLLGLRSLAVRA